MNLELNDIFLTMKYFRSVPIISLVQCLKQIVPYRWLADERADFAVHVELLNGKDVTPDLFVSIERCTVKDDCDGDVLNGAVAHSLLLLLLLSFLFGFFFLAQDATQKGEEKDLETLFGVHGLEGFHKLGREFLLFRYKDTQNGVECLVPLP
jgi:hypothetical protein